MYMRTIFIILSTVFISAFYAQEDSLLVNKEKNLLKLLSDLRSASKNTEKETRNKLFKDYLLETIKIQNAINYPFSKLTTLGSVSSDDKKIRLFNWNIEQDDESQKYYCLILRFDERKKEYLVSELIDNSFMLPAKPDNILEAKDWYGALYYKIIPVSKGNKTIYTLLGLDLNTTMSNIKLIDVLSFTGNVPKLGSPIFKTKTETLKRVFFEHSEKAYMSLTYEENYKRISYDHLSPDTPSMTGFYSYYVPDFTDDAFVLVKDKWVLQEDVAGVNSKGNEKIKILVQNENTGELERKEIKDKWIDPSDVNAVSGGSEHVARTPEGVVNQYEDKTDKFKLFSRKKKELKMDTYSTYPYSELNRRKKRDQKSTK
jgi:hypothetical protein